MKQKFLRVVAIGNITEDTKDPVVLGKLHAEVLRLKAEHAQLKAEWEKL